MGIDDVGAWLVKDVVAPEAAARVASGISKRSSRRRLVAAVRQQTGQRPGRAYRRWLKNPETWKLLELPSVDAYEGLIEGLAAESRARGTAPDAARIDELVTCTIVNYLEVLEPSRAINQHELREEARHLDSEDRADERHQEVLAAVVPAANLEQRLLGVPPRARVILQEELSVELQLKVLGVVEADDPKNVITGLIRLPPDWFRNPDGPLVQAAAELSLVYGMLSEAAALFERAGDLGCDDRQGAYLSAANCWAHLDEVDESDRCLDKARALGPCPLADALQAARSSVVGVLDILDEATASRSALGSILYGELLAADGRDDAAITFLEGRFAAWPEEGAIGLRLSHHLVQRSFRDTAVDRRRDRERAAEMALQVRDARRRWRGNSTEAVEAAVEALAVVGAFSEVLKVGLTPPHGQATVDEASSSEVRFTVGKALLGTGDLETARELASTTPDFGGVLLRADVLAESGADRADVEELYLQAWDMASSDTEKRRLWTSVADFGMVPLPGDDELAEDPDFAALIRASNQSALGRSDQAIADLRPLGHEHARQALVLAYLRDEQIDAAVGELRDMYRRFHHPDYLVRAVTTLLSNDRLQDAAEQSVHALTAIPRAHPDRIKLLEVCIAAAIERHDWGELERFGRQVLSDYGANDRRRWALILALVQQTQLEAAWAVYQDGAHPAVRDATDAKLWIILRSRFALDAQVVARSLEFAEQFADDGEVRRLAVNTWFTAGDARGEISSDVAARWQTQIDLREAHPVEGDSFQVIRFSDDPEEMAEVFREMLEAQAVRAKEWIDKITNEGYPIGTLALAVGRPYSYTIAARPLGFCPIGTPDPSMFEVEIEAASKAIDGVVVADLSALLTGRYIGDDWSRCRAAFQQIEILPEARRDLLAETQQPDLEPKGTLGWDVAGEHLVIHEHDEALSARLREHLQWAAGEVQSMATNLSDPTADGRRIVWLDSLEAARDAGLPLWVDDGGLRALAATSGIPTFGTYALLVALERAGRIDHVATGEALRSLRSEYCVDFAFDGAWMLESARDDDYLGGPALATFTRKSAWHDPAHTFEVWRTIVREAGAADPALPARWVYAASRGILHLFSGAGTQTKARELVSALAVEGIGAAGTPASVPGVMAAAAEACDNIGMDDPAPQIIQSLFEQLIAQLGPARGAHELALLCADLPEGPHLAAYRNVLFRTK